MKYRCHIDNIRHDTLLLVMAGSPRSPEVVTKDELRVKKWLETTTRTKSWSIWSVPECHRSVLEKMTTADKKLVTQHNQLQATHPIVLSRLVHVREQWSRLG